MKLIPIQCDNITFILIQGTALLTVEQKRWKDLKSKLKLTTFLRLPPVPLESETRHKLYDMVKNLSEHVLFSIFEVQLQMSSLNEMLNEFFKRKQ